MRPFWRTSVSNLPMHAASSALGLLRPRQVAFDAHREAVLPPPDSAFEQRHLAAAHQHRRAGRGVQHDAVSPAAAP